MSQINQSRLQTAIKILSIFAVCAAIFVSFSFFRADAKTVIVFLLFLLFYVLLPGSYIVRRFDLQSIFLSSNIIRGFFTGFALNIALYYLTHITGLLFLLYIIGPAISVLWFIDNYKSGVAKFSDSISITLKALPASTYLFAACIFIFSMFSTQYCYISPAYSAFSTIKLDFGYHAGIVNALAAGFPPQDQWIDNYPIHYHYFAEMFISIPVRLFGLTSENLLLECTPYLITPSIALSAYALFREFSVKNERAGLYCLALHFSNMFILKQNNDSWFLYHIYSNINNAGLGIACMLTALPLLKEWDNVPASSQNLRSNGGKGKMILLAALVMLMTGIKGPVAIVFAGGIAGTLILGLFLRNFNRNQIALTVLSIISFVLVYVYVVGTEHDNMSTGSILNLGEVTDIFFLKENIMDSLTNHGLPRAASLLVLLGIFSLFFLSAFFIPFIIGYIREFILVISKRRDFSFSKISAYACWMVGFLAMMILDFDGHSQVYFGFASCMLTPLIAFWFIEDFEEHRTVIAKIIRIAFAVCLVVFSVTSLTYAYDSVIRSYVNYETRNDELTKYRCVSTQEYEGLIWLRDNTDKDALVASDRYFSVSPKEYSFDKRSHNYHFAYAIYSQRRQYLEGSGFSMEKESDLELRYEMIKNNNRLYDPANDARGDDARELGVDYVVVSKRFNDVDPLENEDFELCFSNKHMDIYKIKEL